MTHRSPGRTTSLGRTPLFVAAALCALPAAALAGKPFPTARTPAPQDLGALTAAGSGAPITVSVLLKLRDQAQLEALVAAQHQPGNAQFRHFLSPAQFQRRFGPAPATVAAASAYFRGLGLTVDVTDGRVLQITGSTAAVQAAFNTRLHQYEVAAHGRTPAYRFHAPQVEPAVASAAVAAGVEGIFGLDSRPLFRPNLRQAALGTHRLQPNTHASATLNPPGQWTVSDFAQYYDVAPLYAKGLTGAGRTLGIVTLASFTPSDAYAYWSGLGLSVDPNRIRVVDVDGGPGAPSDVSGSEETTLDVEQSGGLAPGAKVVVYQAPNTDQGFIDAFAHAISDNQADSFSVSWGLWEYWDTQSSVTLRRRAQVILDAQSSLFLQAAVQGQSGFAASGDSGAYEPNNPGIAPVPYFSKTLGVGSPASAAWITAAGGTTLPGEQDYRTPNGPYVINIASEQAWGWSYLSGLCAALGYDDISCGIFPGGSGGGVSSYIRRPFYQRGVPGMRNTEPGQTFTDFTVSPAQDYVTLPAGFAGRNVPDVSANADPQTGYLVVYTSDQSGFGVSAYYGGTSFVAPQFNGVAAVIDQGARGRTGLWNFALYALARNGQGYRGRQAPLRDVSAGDNWFYSGVPGYEPATGVGVLDVANFARIMMNDR
jgi:kumamolisin